jgi:hypothetical protein
MAMRRRVRGAVHLGAKKMPALACYFLLAVPCSAAAKAAAAGLGDASAEQKPPAKPAGTNQRTFSLVEKRLEQR